METCKKCGRRALGRVHDCCASYSIDELTSEQCGRYINERVEELKSQKYLLEQEEWDTLILLDACRFDYFLPIHDNFVSGSLYEVYSSGG